MKTELYLVFCHRDHWGNKLLKTGFSHVYILKKDKYNWYMLNPHCRILSFSVLDIDINTDIPKLISYGKNDIIFRKNFKHHQKVIKVNIDMYNSSIPFISILPKLNCVGIAMYAIGINKCIFTPYRLYKFLLKQCACGSFVKPITNVKLI